MSRGVKGLIEVEQYHIDLIRKHYNIRQEDVDRDVDSIIEWYEKQPHLPQTKLDRRFVESCLIRKKYSIERAKEAVDMYFSYRHLMPEFYDKRDPGEIARMGKICGTLLPLPTLDKEAVRVCILKVGKPYENMSYADSIRFTLSIGEYRGIYDYGIAQRHIFDLKNYGVSHFLHINPVITKKGAILEKKVFGTKVVGVHFLNGGAFIEKLLPMLKPLINPKVYSRIHVHDSIEDLYKYVQKEILPSEYGGEAGTFDELTDRWVKLHESKEFKEWFTEHDKLRSDESKRIGQKLSSDLLGIPGSFRQLNVD